MLTGRATLSARITHAVQWKQRGAALIGEPGRRARRLVRRWQPAPSNSQLAVHYTNGSHEYSRRDYPSLQGGVMLVSSIVILVNLMVDVLYGVINPRIRHGR